MDAFKHGVNCYIRLQGKIRDKSAELRLGIYSGMYVFHLYTGEKHTGTVPGKLNGPRSLTTQFSSLTFPFIPWCLLPSLLL